MEAWVVRVRDGVVEGVEWRVWGRGGSVGGWGEGREWGEEMLGVCFEASGLGGGSWEWG